MIDLFDWDGDSRSGTFARLRDDLDAFIRGRSAIVEHTESATDLRGAVDEALVTMVNRDIQIGHVEDLLEAVEHAAPQDRFVCLLEGCVEDWAEALAHHIKLRHTPDWEAHVHTRQWQAKTLRLLGYSPSAFERALYDSIGRSRTQDPHRVLAWLEQQGEDIRVLYAQVDLEERPDALIGLVDRTVTFLQSLPAFSPGKKVIVLFGCIWRKRKPPWLRRWLLARYLAKLQRVGCVKVDRLGLISAFDLGAWVNGFSDALVAHYDRERLREILYEHCPEGVKHSYLALKPKLAEALAKARMQSDG